MSLLIKDGKLLTTDGKIIDVQGGSGSNGLPIEVEELPVKWQGTTVPNEGTVEKVYFNTALSVDEVKSIMDTLTYETNVDLNIWYCVLVYVNEAMDYTVKLTKYNGAVDSTQAHYSIETLSAINGITDIFVWNNITGEENVGQDGWKGIDSIDINAETVLSQVTSYGFTVQNDKFSSLISTTPFVENEIVEGGVYKTTAKEGTYTAYIYVDSTLLTLEEMITLMGASFSYNIVDSLPTENILVSSEGVFNVYYHKNNGVYVYGDLEGNGVYDWADFCYVMGIEFKGDVSSVDDIPASDGVYILNGLTPEMYYLYDDSKFNDLLSYKESRFINQVFKYGAVYKGNLLFGTEGSAEYLMKFHEDCVEIIANITDALTYFKIYTRTYFYYSSTLKKYELNHNFYLKTSNSIFIPLPYFISIGADGYMNGGNYISLEFNLNGSKFRVSGLTSDKSGNFSGTFNLQEDSTEWDNLIETLGVPEITEDTEV